MERGGVRDDKSFDSVGMALRVAHADHAAPIVDQQCHSIVNAEGIEQRFEIVDAAFQGIIVTRFIRFIRLAATDVVGHDAAEAVP